MFLNDIRNTLDLHFKFLQEQYDFPSFDEEQIAYEYHFISKKANLKFDIWFELAPSSPIWVSLNGHYIEKLEPENLVLKNYRKDLKNVDQYLYEISAIIQRNPQLLKADFSLFLLETAIKTTETNGYLLKYGEMELECEELEGLKSWIEDFEIKDYTILDRNGNEIKLLKN
jgi:hypothetical protein